MTPGASEHSSQKGTRSIVDEQLTVANVAREHGVGGVAGLLANAPGRNTRLGRAGGESCTKAVARIAAWIETRSRAPAP